MIYRRFSVQSTPLAGLMRIERQRMNDPRGSFSRLFCSQELQAAGFDAPIAQVNHTVTSRQGAVRGLHYQSPPYAEIKFVSCVRGQVFDVAVDLRRNSPTFLQWHAQRLSADNMVSLLIPSGFAHGFQVLSDGGAELLYLHSCVHAPEAEGGFNPQDPRIGVEWPLPIVDLSARDAALPLVDDRFDGLAPDTP